MTILYIIKTLDLHSIPYKVVGGHVFADSMLSGKELFEETEDVTYWTRDQLFGWLGY